MYSLAHISTMQAYSHLCRQTTTSCILVSNFSLHACPYEQTARWSYSKESRHKSPKRRSIVFVSNALVCIASRSTSMVHLSSAGTSNPRVTFKTNCRSLNEVSAETPRSKFLSFKTPLLPSNVSMPPLSDTLFCRWSTCWSS